MSPLLALSVLCALMLGSFTTSNSYSSSHHDELKSFREDGVDGTSPMVLSEDLGVLLLGAREAIYALSLKNISVKESAVSWKTAVAAHDGCLKFGRSQVACWNYIQTMHVLDKTTVLVCGTNAYQPTCAYLAVVNGQMSLKGEPFKAQANAPLDPFQSSASVMVGSDLYSAASSNVFGGKPVFQRSSDQPLTSKPGSWFGDPTFVHMEFVRESFYSEDGDDDKIYLFFSEAAKKFDSYRQVGVSRVARVCKGDVGGPSAQDKSWTSFLKAPLECSHREAGPPTIVQDVFFVENNDWRRSVFYAVFASPPGQSQTSLVCAYSVLAIRKVFNQGKFQWTGESSRRTESGPVPVPRPGACINNAARRMGIRSSRELPARTLKFLADHQLMDEAVQPETSEPLLVVNGPLLTRIVVDTITALDGRIYTVMFVGTDNGYVKKAVNYGEGMLVIEKVQLYQESVSISTLRLSESKGQIYAGSETGVVQMSVSNCSRYASCVDCVLARDPYCAWDLATRRCSSVTALSSTALQSLKDGDTSHCDPVLAVDLDLVPGANIRLPCKTPSNLAEVLWQHSGQTLRPSDKHHIYDWGLLITGASTSDTGLYVCDSVQQANGKTYKKTVAVYRLQLATTTAATPVGPPAADMAKPPVCEERNDTNLDVGKLLAERQNGTVIVLYVVVILLVLVCVSLMMGILWIWKKGRFRAYKVVRGSRQGPGGGQPNGYKACPKTSAVDGNLKESVI